MIYLVQKDSNKYAGIIREVGELVKLDDTNSNFKNRMLLVNQGRLKEMQNIGEVPKCSECKRRFLYKDALLFHQSKDVCDFRKKQKEKTEKDIKNREKTKKMIEEMVQPKAK